MTYKLLLITIIELILIFIDINDNLMYYIDTKSAELRTLRTI
jgi:hypothetical protein